ncbi:MAG TPA: hypothetical protein VG713_12710 [Pirellulales bacterium]|nr:hypothetical protein [Pirellulales bacterium]
MRILRQLTWRAASFAILSSLALVAGRSVQAADDAPLLVDHFTTLDPGWGQADKVKSVEGNKLLVTLEPELAFRTLYEAKQFGAADIRLKITELKGGTDQPAGVVFWAADRENCYAALLTPDGSVYASRRMAGQWLTPVSATKHDEVLKGLGQTNELRVVTSGRVATVFVNDKQVTRFVGFPPNGPSKIGVIAESGEQGATWAFSDLSVRNAPAATTPLASADAALLLTDDFQVLDPGWGNASDLRTVEGNKLLIKLKPELAHRTLYEGSLFDNIDVRLNVSQTNGDADQPAGIVFWAVDYANYYAALVQPDGSFGVLRVMNGKSLHPVANSVRPAVHTGAAQTNELRVVTEAHQATVYVNGTQQAIVKGYAPVGGSKIGVHAESGEQPATWAFSDLRVASAPGPVNKTPWKDQTVLLEDNFDTFDPSWGVPNDTKQASGNKLLVNLKPGLRFVDLNQVSLYDDVDVMLNFAPLGSWTDQLVGLVFWADSLQDYCPLVIDPDGDVYVGRILQGKWKGMNIIKGGARNANKDPGKPNQLRVVTHGDSATVMLNNRAITTYQGAAPKKGSLIGVYVETDKDPASFAFSELRVRTPLVTPANNASRTDGLLLTDDFRAFPSDWGDPDDVESVVAGWLMLRPKPNTGRTLMYEGRFEDADIRVTINEAQGGPDRPAGIVFWGDDNKNYYLAALRPDGLFTVSKQADGDWTFPINKVQVAAPGQQFTLRVVTRGSTATIYAGDQPIGTVDGGPPKNGQRVGLHAVSGNDVYTWYLTNFSVRKPEPIANGRTVGRP